LIAGLRHVVLPVCVTLKSDYAGCADLASETALTFYVGRAWAGAKTGRRHFSAEMGGRVRAGPSDQCNQ
jgi:hypothetical protein